MGRSFEVRKASMAKTQGAKIKVYSKYGKEIYVCAKNGGTDPDMNLSLRHLITEAKKHWIKPAGEQVKITNQHVTKVSALVARV